MFSIGQKVRVRRGLKLNELYGGVLFTSEMLKHRDKIVTITKIENDKYKILEDEGLNYWAKEMLNNIRISSKEKSELKDGDIVRVLSEPYKDKRAFYRKGYLEFFEYMGGHNGNDKGTNGYCWYLSKEEYEKVELQKVNVYDTTKIYSIEASANLFERNKLMPIYNAGNGTITSLSAFKEQLKENNECELVCEILEENSDKMVLRKNGKYFICLPEGTAEPSVDNNSELTKQLMKSINDLGKKIEERSPFQEAMTQAIIEKGKELATEDLKKELKQELNDFIEKTYGVLPKKMIIEREETKRDVSGLFHKDFEKICKIVDSNVPLMLVGGAGAGKNHTLEQVAEALGLTFYTTNAVNQDYKLTGFIDANGKYHETEFYKAFTNGGMFFLDEIDASCPEALIILNGAIANKYFDFPVGRVQAHKDFRVVCAGNTYGTGADMVYVGRNVLDGATLDRFVVLNFDYDEDVEKALAYDKDLFTFIRDLRKAVNDSGLRYIVSMRALINSTKLLEIGIDKETILKTTIIKNMQVDDINTIVKKIKHNNDWLNSLRRMSDIDD